MKEKWRLRNKICDSGASAGYATPTVLTFAILVGMEREQNYAFHIQLTGDFKGPTYRNTTSRFTILEDCQVCKYITI